MPNEAIQKTIAFLVLRSSLFIIVKSPKKSYLVY